MQAWQSCITDDALPADRENLTHLVQEVERGNPVWLLNSGDSKP